MAVRRDYQVQTNAAPPSTAGAVDYCPPRAATRIGVTIATPAYMAMAVEAVRRWKLYSGLEAIILTSEPGVCWWAKYDLASLLPGRQVCFFDADVHFVDHLPLDELWPDGVDLTAIADPGVHDPLAFPAPDCVNFHLDPAKYFNGGLWACDFSNPLLQAWMHHARTITLGVKAGTFPRWYDFGEQTALNIAAKMTGLRLGILDPGWAFFHWAWQKGVLTHPNRVLGVHAAGYHGTAGKTTTLATLTAAYTKP